MIFSKHKIVSNDSLESDIKVPAPLNLPFGKLFFGFNVIPYTLPPVPNPNSSGVAPVSTSIHEMEQRFLYVPQVPIAFGGVGATLNGRSSQPQPSTSSSKGRGKEPATSESTEPKWGTGGQTLGSRSRAPLTFNSRDVGAGGAPVPQLPSRRSGNVVLAGNGKGKAKKEKSPSPEHDWGVEDDDIIEIDSD